jgi:hypothetical protein
MVPHDPINVAEALFGLYTSVYLTFGVLVRVLTPPDASAAVAEPADNPIECRPGAASGP